MEGCWSWHAHGFSGTAHTPIFLDEVDELGSYRRFEMICFEVAFDVFTMLALIKRHIEFWIDLCREPVHGSSDELGCVLRFLHPVIVDALIWTASVIQQHIWTCQLHGQLY